MCPSMENIKRNVGISKCNHAESKKTFWEDVFKHYKTLYGKCIPATLDDFASECVHYNVNI